MRWDYLGQLRSKRKRHPGTACIMRSKEKRNRRPGYVLYFIFIYRIYTFSLGEMGICSVGRKREKHDWEGVRKVSDKW